MDKFNKTYERMMKEGSSQLDMARASAVILTKEIKAEQKEVEKEYKLAEKDLKDAQKAMKDAIWFHDKAKMTRDKKLKALMKRTDKVNKDVKLAWKKEEK